MPAHHLALAAARSIGCGWPAICYPVTTSTAAGWVVIHPFAGTSRRFVYCLGVVAGGNGAYRWLLVGFIALNQH